MIFHQLKITLPVIKTNDIEKSLKIRMNDCLETQLSIENDPFGFQYLELHPDLVTIKNQKVNNHQFEYEQHVTKSFGCISKENQVRIFLTENIYLLQRLVIIIALINTAAFCLIDYEERDNHHRNTRNQIALILETSCNVIIGIEIVIQCICYGVIIGNGTYLRNIWSILNVLTFLCTWSIYFDQSSTFIQILRVIRLFRLVRIVQEISYLREHAENFFQSFLTIHTILIPTIIVMFGFSIIGLHLLRGATGFRCAKNGIIDQSIPNFCGEWECPDGYVCVEDFNQNDLKTLDFYYGFDNFDTIYEAFLMSFLFLNATGWSKTTYMFWRSVSQQATAIYFIVMLFILHYIFSDLILATLYESFLVQSAIKGIKKTNRSELFTQRRKTVTLTNNHKKAQINFHKLHMIEQIQQQNKINVITPQEILRNDSVNPNQVKSSSYLKGIKLIDNLFTISSTIILCVNKIEKENSSLYYADLVMNFQLIIITCIKLIIFSKYRKKIISLIDCLLSLALLIIIILEFSNINNTVFVIIKSLKAFRSIKLLYKVKYFGIIKLLLRCLIQTLFKIRHLIILWMVFAFFSAIIGQELFANYVQESEEIEIHFNGLGNSFMAVINIFYAEEWHVTMYQHALLRPVSSFLFFLIQIILDHTLFMRLLRALFLNEFGKKLNELDKNYSQTDYLQRAWIFLCSLLSIQESNQNISQQQQLQPSYTQSQQQPQAPQQSQLDDEAKTPLHEITQQVSLQKSTSLEQQQNNNQTIQQSSLSITIVENFYFRLFILFVVLLSAIKSGIQNPLIDPNSNEKLALDIIFYFVTGIFIFEFILNITAYGIYQYFKQSMINILSFIIIIVNIIAICYGNPSQIIFSLFDSLRVFTFLKTGSDFFPLLKQALQALFNAFTKMIQLAIFSVIILLLYSIIGMQLLSNSLYYCKFEENNNELEIENIIHNKYDCFDLGGDWINNTINFDTIFQSINLLFCVSTSEEWIPLMSEAWMAKGVNLEPHENYNRYWAIYYQLFFFIGNILVLGMFVTLVIETYIKTREESQNLNLLDDRQREWFQIKQQILHLKPKIKQVIPQNLIKNLCFRLNKYLQIPFLIIIFSNIIILSLYYARMNANYELALDTVNQVFLFAQLFEIILNLINTQDIKFGIYEFICIILCIIFSFMDFIVLETLSVAFQVTRIHKLTGHFKFISHLFHAIFAVLPNTASMFLMMIVILYCFTVVSCDMFAYLRPQIALNGFDMHFRDFWTALMTLVKVSTGENWWIVLQETATQQSPSFACNYIETYDQYVEYGFNGCGTNLSYLFFILFALIFSIMTLNLLIANIIGAYEQYHKSEQSAISKYQLLDVLELWATFDEKGEGYINYKLFWRLSSQIAIIFGLEQSDLLDVNNKKHFLRALKIPIYELKDSNVLCYRFHDVIISLTRISVTIKYGVINLEPDDQEIYNKVYGNQHHHIESKFRETQFNSGDMVAIIFIQQKFREWKQKSLLKSTVILGNIGDIRQFMKRNTKTSLGKKLSESKIDE